MSERWKPKNGGVYYLVFGNGYVAKTVWQDSPTDEILFERGNYFKTEAEAVFAAEKVKALLLSLKDNGETLQDSIQDKQLPDWCKVGEWVFDKAINKYSQVATEDVTEGLQEIRKIISKGEIVQARLRPFNADEMKALVGKVIEDQHGAHLIISFIKPDPAENLSAFIRAGQCWIAADRLLSGYTIARKPAGVLEHLDNGEWVE